MRVLRTGLVPYLNEEKNLCFGNTDNLVIISHSFDISYLIAVTFEFRLIKQ